MPLYSSPAPRLPPSLMPGRAPPPLPTSFDSILYSEPVRPPHKHGKPKKAVRFHERVRAYDDPYPLEARDFPQETISAFDDDDDDDDDEPAEPEEWGRELVGEAFEKAVQGQMPTLDGRHRPPPPPPVGAASVGRQRWGQTRAAFFPDQEKEAEERRRRERETQERSRHSSERSFSSPSSRTNAPLPSFMADVVSQAQSAEEEKTRRSLSSPVSDRGRALPIVGEGKRGSVDMEKGDSGYGSVPNDGGYLGYSVSAMGSVGSKVVEGWGSIKSAVVGGGGGSGEAKASSSPPSEGGGSHLWSRFVSPFASAASSVSTLLPVGSSTSQPDEEKASGDSSLSLAIKEFHISRSTSAEEVPSWVLSPAEQAARDRRASPLPPNLSSSPAQPPPSSRSLPSSPQDRRARPLPTPPSDPPSQAQQEGPTKLVSAAERLKRLKEERRRGIVGST